MNTSAAATRRPWFSSSIKLGVDPVVIVSTSSDKETTVNGLPVTSSEIQPLTLITGALCGSVEGEGEGDNETGKASSGVVGRLLVTLLKGETEAETLVVGEVTVDGVPVGEAVTTGEATMATGTMVFGGVANGVDPDDLSTTKDGDSDGISVGDTTGEASIGIEVGFSLLGVAAGVDTTTSARQVTTLDGESDDFSVGGTTGEGSTGMKVGLSLFGVAAGVDMMTSSRQVTTLDGVNDDVTPYESE